MDITLGSSTLSTILIVDDEKNIVELAQLYLEKEGFKVASAANGIDGLEKAHALKPALVILDVMMPEMDGFAVCRRLRQTGDVPIIMLTARNEDVDKIVGLELGADDYLAKPFNPRELTARVKAVLRRYAVGQHPTKTLQLGDLFLDIEKREVTVKEERITLRTREFDLLSTLIQNQGIVLSRDRLLEMIWGYDYYGETRTVDVHINHLRDKLTGSLLVIESVRGIGYRLVEES